ncbi:hypothetical protein CY34DRAFT_804417 [Suillus luteus UH-Slu-Lm8-n1]|uniref:Uncharacterized protein n=1 Tax=Suillus luteus UH-Slu-Lm8-n1 TaxID=930992 RepID=A0A0D0AYS0_9AGAM|nr:hypothetical protein CY34DRAFT_804417 [Suillus luteus UH-Slu-Lm8-n1]
MPCSGAYLSASTTLLSAPRLALLHGTINNQSALILFRIYIMNCPHNPPMRCQT